MSFKTSILVVFVAIVLLQTVTCDEVAHPINPVNPVNCQFIAIANESISIECPVHTDDVTWYKLGKAGENPVKIEDGPKYTIHSENQTLFIKKAGQDNSGDYKCANGTENVVTLCVYPWVKPYDKPKNVIEGDPFQSECVAWGYPPVAVEWRHMTKDGAERLIVANNDVILKAGSCENSTIRIKSVQDKDAGIYTCSVSSPIGTANATIVVNVKDKLAALWPFLGICAEVAILCIIIFLYERRRAKRLEKEAASEETDRMNVNNETRASEEVRHRK